MKQTTKPVQRQCAHCPWRLDCVPETDIPNGYSKGMHCDLKRTIATPGALNIGGTLRMMACHESKVGEEKVCVGWLANQLGPGNNIGLRMAMIRGSLPHFETVGEQHECFEDTLPDSDS